MIDADWDGVAQECARKPGLCDQGIAYEKLLMGSHNARVARSIDIATAITGGTVCHSYPNVFGGEDTVCHR